MKVGAHVKASGGVDKAIGRAEDIGAEAIQIFSGAPQAWRRKEYRPEEVEAYKTGAAEKGIGPAFIHGVYQVSSGVASTILRTDSTTWPNTCS